MTKKAPHARPMLPTPPDLHALEEYRLTRQLTYRQLTQDIEETTQFHRSEDGWRQICRGTCGTSRRTQYVIDLFFEKKGFSPKKARAS